MNHQNPLPLKAVQVQLLRSFHPNREVPEEVLIVRDLQFQAVLQRIQLLYREGIDIFAPGYQYVDTLSVLAWIALIGQKVDSSNVCVERRMEVVWNSTFLITNINQITWHTSIILNLVTIPCSAYSSRYIILLISLTKTTIWDFYKINDYYKLFFTVCEWTWDSRYKSTAAKIQDDARTVIFHPNFSNGTAAVRGSVLMKDGQHFWEIKMITPVYGTNMVMFLSHFFN